MSLLSNENPAGLFSFAGSVGRFGDNNRDDVIKAQALLANAGYYDLPDPGMPTGWPGGELNRALTRFQKDHGLEPDGTLLPLDPSGVTQNGVGETVLALQAELGDRLKGLVAPDVQEADDFYQAHPMMGGNGTPPTNVRLHGDNGTSGYVALKPMTVASDTLPPSIKPEAGQQLALMRDPRRDPTLRDNFMLDGPFVTGGGGGPRGGGQPTSPQKMQTPAKPNPERNIRNPAAPGQTSPSQAAPDHDATRPPEPAQPEEDRQQQDFAKPQRGRIIIAEDGKELHVPPLGTWTDKLTPENRQIAEALNDALAEEMAIKSGGSRGSEHTQEGVNAGIQGCIEALGDVLPEAVIEHIAGGNFRGNAKNDALSEEHLWDYNEEGKRVRKGSNRSDWTILVLRNIAAAIRGNTYDTQGGNVAGREALAETGISSKANDDQMVMVEKHGGTRSEADIRQDAYKRCYDAALKIRSDWAEKGEFQRPKPELPAKYEGPANARRARDIRRMRGVE